MPDLPVKENHATITIATRFSIIEGEMRNLVPRCDVALEDREARVGLGVTNFGRGPLSGTERKFSVLTFQTGRLGHDSKLERRPRGVGY